MLLRFSLPSRSFMHAIEKATPLEVMVMSRILQSFRSSDHPEFERIGEISCYCRLREIHKSFCLSLKTDNANKLAFHQHRP